MMPVFFFIISSQLKGVKRLFIKHFFKFWWILSVSNVRIHGFCPCRRAVANAAKMFLLVLVYPLQTRNTNALTSLQRVQVYNEFHFVVWSDFTLLIQT